MNLSVSIHNEGRGASAPMVTVRPHSNTSISSLAEITNM